MNMNTNLRPEAGGDPTRGPARTDSHETAPSSDGNDFPDAPDPTPDATPQDQPDLDAFAERMGTDSIETGERLDAVPDRNVGDAADTSDRFPPRMIIAGAGALVAAILVLAFGRRKRRGVLDKAAALGAAANIVSN